MGKSSSNTMQARPKVPKKHGSGGRKKSGEAWKAFKRFLKSIKPYRGWIIFSICLAVGAVGLWIMIPKLLGDMTNIAVNTYPEIDFGSILGLVWLVLGLLVSAAALNYAQAFILTIVSAKYTRDLREQIIEKISRLPIAYFDKHKYGDTLSSMTNDVDIIAGSLSQEITDISQSVSTLVGTMVIMLTISMPLSLLAFIVVPMSVVVVGKIMNHAQKFFELRQNTLGALNSVIEEDYTDQLIIKANSHEALSLADFDRTNQKLARVTRKAQFLSQLSMPITATFTNLSYIVVTVAGGMFTIQGQITIGALQAFIQYVSRFNRPITEIASATATIQGLLASTERVFKFLEQPEEEPDVSPAREIVGVKGAVEFHHVDFNYLPDKPVIRNFSVHVEPGMKVAIVGPTGAGKTTLINLLMRFYDPVSGYITIDGVPTREMKRSDVRRLFGMVLQDTWLFSGTVKENLRYGCQSASLSDIKRAAKMCNVHHVIEALPHTYHSIISEDSDNISAGEKQLITIARAMVANPPMMILDEATSNVDTRTERLIQDSFEKLTHGRTSFVIAHRLSTIRNSDLILVMRDGNIVEQGTHTELLKAGGFYAELYNSQFAEN
ncbi:ABC transporter ATP-binding protein [Candidatus Saccharibacteria bacterium]|nr:ABC transporter ATP-binding protein [Candidatus Saccharibacteria bacterium]